MRKPKTTHITSIVAPLFIAAMLVCGCGGVDDGGVEDETADTDESVETDESIGEAESELMRAGGGCGWYCPSWAKDLSDCLMIPCDD
jgi:hypothetical protein